MRRAIALAGGGAVAACIALALTATSAEATGESRLAAASLLARQVGHHGLHGPAPDRAMVLGAWRDAGVDINGLGTPVDLLHACGLLDVSAPRPAGPAPGDYALYRDSGGADRIGMFLSPIDVVIVDAGAVRSVPRPELSGDIGDVATARLLAQPGSFHACRLAAARWPGATDDTSVGIGRIALADPAQTAEHLGWAAEHPRDADHSVFHTLTRIVAAAFGGVLRIVEELVAGVFSAIHALLEWLPFRIGAPLLLLGDLLGRRFDGRRLHTILSWIVFGVLALAVGGAALVPLAWIVAGTTLGARLAGRSGTGLLGAVGGAIVGGGFAVASFLTGVVTGIDDSDRVCVGTVLFAFAADALWVRPLVMTLGLAAHIGHLGGVSQLLGRAEQMRVLRYIGGGGGSALDISGTVGDALSLRPHALAHAVKSIAHVGTVTAGDSSTIAARGAAGALAVHKALSPAEALTAIGARGVDMLSLTWRPSSIASDLVGHAADALHFVDGEMRTGYPSMPWLRRALGSLTPRRRDMLSAVLQRTSTHVVPQVQATARLAHLHSGGQTLTALATGQPNTASWWKLWQSPVVRRVLHGLPVAPGGRGA